MQHHIVNLPWMFLSFFPKEKQRREILVFAELFCVLCLLFMRACMLLATQIRDAFNDDL